VDGHVFISYAHESGDTTYVERLAAFLTEAHITVWFDKEIIVGERWERVVRKQIDTCAALIVVMTPEAERSVWVTREINQAERTNRPVFPLLLAGHEFFRLSDIQYEDVSGGRMPPLRFIERLRHLLQLEPTAAATPTPLPRHADLDDSVTDAPDRAALVDIPTAPSRSPIVVTVEVPGANYVHVRDPSDGRSVLVPASGHTVRIFVEAIGPQTVLLTALRPTIVSRQPALAGRPSPHLGAIERRPFRVLLDDDPPILEPVQHLDGGIAYDFPFTVAANDPEVFDLTAHTNSDVRWVLMLDWICAGLKGKTKIDLAGHSFRTMAMPYLPLDEQPTG
jgi:hypothetical protein